MRRNSGGNPAVPARETEESDAIPFARLFRDAFRKCFSAELTAPLTESESHRLSVEITESTGLEIGWKSLKNYSHYLLGSTSRVENPSIPTLDTLARYVAGAPRTTEEQRRSRERHYPYWFRFRDALRVGQPVPTTPEPRDERPGQTSGDPEVANDASPTPRRPSRLTVAVVVAALAMALALLFVARRAHQTQAARFTDDFDDVSVAGLASREWSVHSVDSAHWTRRTETPGHLTLFTLEGDNWPQPGRPPVIHDLLVRRLSSECFVVDVRFTAFVPTRNWEQAGLLLLEDTALAGRSARLSIAYNDFSGGFPQTREVLVQGITSLGRESDKPEEIVHHRLFVEDSATESLVRENLRSSALRIERRGPHLRLLYSAGPMKNSPFKEVGSADFDFRPAYVAVFAMRGFVSQPDEVPVHVDAFSQSELSCSR
jgi:hypothetical protein